MSKKLSTIIALVAIGIAGRLLPHFPNATPVSAISHAGSRHVGRVWAVLIPILAMLISDAVIGFYSLKILASVYFSFAMIGGVSMLFKKYDSRTMRTVFAITASLLFFLITNFTVWAFSPWYAKSIWGLLYCYELGLPFLAFMLLGDLFYVHAISTAFDLAKRRGPFAPMHQFVQSLSRSF